MAGFKTGLALGVAVTGAAAGWLLYKLENQPLIFAPFYVGIQSDYISVNGSLIGDNPEEKERPIHNGMQLTCYRPNNTCDYMHIEQIGSRQLGLIDNETLYVRKWDDKEMVADSLAEPEVFSGCNYYEIRVLLTTKDVTYTRLPNPKADQKTCKVLFGNSAPLRQWRIGNGRGWGDYKWGTT